MDDKLKWLSQIVEAEAKGEKYKGKVAVANVVLNRVKSPLFPNNIYDVIFDTKNGVQFEPVANGTIYNNPSTESINAATQALNGQTVVPENCLFFLNLQTASSSWIPKYKKHYDDIGKHSFYLEA